MKKVHIAERSGKSYTIALPVDYGIDQRIRNSGLWAATVVYLAGTTLEDHCALRERPDGGIERQFRGEMRASTGTRIRHQAIKQVLDLIAARELDRRTQGESFSSVAEARGSLRIDQACALIRKLGLHRHAGAKQQAEYELVMDIACVVWVGRKLHEINPAACNVYFAKRSGRNIKGYKLDREALARIGIDEVGIVFPESYRTATGRPRKTLKPADAVTAKNDLNNLQTLFNYLKAADMERPYIGSNPLDGIDFGDHGKRRMSAATPERYAALMRVADEAVRVWNQKQLDNQYARTNKEKPVRQVPVGILRAMLATAYHTGMRYNSFRSLCTKRAYDILRTTPEIRAAIEDSKVKKGQDKLDPEWASYFINGAFRFRPEYAQKPGYDRVVPINSALRRETDRWERLRGEAGYGDGWLFCYDDGERISHVDSGDMVRIAERLARKAIEADGGDPDEVVPPIPGNVWHAFRRHWENLRDSLGWFHNKNAAWCGGWSTKIGGPQDVVYKNFKPWFIMAVAEGKAVTDVLNEHGETDRARAAARMEIAFPEDRPDPTMKLLA